MRKRAARGFTIGRAAASVRRVFRRLTSPSPPAGGVAVRFSGAFARVHAQIHSIAALATTGAGEAAGGGTVSAAIEALHEAERAVTDLLRRPPRSLADYRAAIDRFNASQPNASLLTAIRDYNHHVVDALHASADIGGRAVLDVGASPHGYALERALELEAGLYVGIGLDVAEHTVVCGPTGIGELFAGDAEALPFDDNSFDAVVTLSTFEHIQHVDRALAEMHRVVRHGGTVLVTFEPLWTCSYGHHLHHFGPVSDLVPPWAHLWWTRHDMHAALASKWPADAPVALGAAVRWVYDDDGLNRIGIRRMQALLRGSALEVAWLEPLRDQLRDPAALAAARDRTGLTEDELMTKGFSVLLRKGA